VVRKQKVREYKISAIKTKAYELFGSVGFRAFVYFFHHHRRSAFIFTVLVNKLSVSVCEKKAGMASRHGARFELLVVRHNLKVLNWVSALNRLLYATFLYFILFYFIFNLARFNFYLSIF
jgi:hypothetical protein